MSLLLIASLLLLGVAAGYLSGLVGIGGGIIIVPALVLLFGFSQLTAQGTTLGILVMPVGILAVLKYYQNGHIDIKTAALIGAGFILGGYLGSLTALSISQSLLRKIFAFVLVAVGIKMFFGK